MRARTKANSISFAAVAGALAPSRGMTEVVIARGWSDDPKRFSELTRLNLPPVARRPTRLHPSRYQVRELTFVGRPSPRNSQWKDTDVSLSTFACHPFRSTSR